MKKLTIVSLLVLTASVLSSMSFAASVYVVANNNDNSPGRNALTVYRLDTTTGVLTQIAVLATEATGAGEDALQYLVNVEEAISPGAECVFALNVNIVPQPSDIASFSKATGYAKVGNYSSPSVNESDPAGSLALTPDGKFLYATYSGTGNVGAWAVNPDCSLTFIDAYSPGASVVASALKVTPNGAYLVSAGGGAELFAINQATGALTDIGSLPLTSCQRENACYTRGLDFTRDSRVVVFAGNWAPRRGSLVPVAISAAITPTGFAQARGWSLENAAFLGENNVPFFSAAGYAGSGNLYFDTLGTSGFPGVLTASFTEHPVKIALTAATVTGVSTPPYDAAMAITGNILVLAEYPNQIAVSSINPDGSLTHLSTTTVKGELPGMFSLSVFPNTR